MPTGWQTFPIDFTGGWITNLSRLEHGINAPGSATILRNFEPSVVGGYQKVRGYTRFSDVGVPGTGRIVGVVAPDEARALAYREGTYYVSTGAGWTSKVTVPFPGSQRIKHVAYNFDGQSKVMVVDGINKPAIYNVTTDTMTVDTAAPTDVQGASNVALFKNHLFLANNANLIFTAPFTDNNYSVGAGANNINTGGRITGLIVFRDQLIIFHVNKILRLTGSTEADFQILPIASNMGCLCPHTVQEVGGDVMYLGPDGVRWLSATERNNDFGLERASENIQSEMTNIVNTNCFYSSLTIKYKNQYRLFSYLDNVAKRNSRGFVATKFSDQSTNGIEWAELRGFKVFSSDTFQSRDREIILFSSDDSLIYRMDAGNSLDGQPISWEFETPYMPITDPRLRKTFYKHSLYLKGSGRINILCRTKLDYGEKDIIQPEPFDIQSGTEDIYYYDDPSSIYGQARYSTRPSTLITNNLVGSGLTVAFNYSGLDTQPSFLLENAIIEFAQNGRR